SRLALLHGRSAIVSPRSWCGLLARQSELQELSFSGQQFRHALLAKVLVIVQNPQRGKGSQKLVGLQHVHRMAGTAGKPLLINSVGLVNQKPARSKRGDQSREEFTLKVKENQYQIVLFMTQIADSFEIEDFEFHSRNLLFAV